MKLQGISYLMTLLMIVPVACDMDQKAEKSDIGQVIDHSISWFKTKDFPLLFSTLASDSTLFIYQPTSDGTVRGIEQFREHADVWNDPENKYVSHEIRDLDISIGPSGDVAWFSAELDDCGEYHGKTGCWEKTRWTGVLVKRKGKWVVVQQHFSFAADVVAERVKATMEKAH